MEASARIENHFLDVSQSSSLEAAGLNVGLALLQSTGEGELGWNTEDAVSGVDVLDKSNLVAGSTSLTGNDGGVGKEVLPDL